MKKIYLIFASFISLSAAESTVEKEHIPWRITPNELFGLLQTPVPAHRIGSLVQRAARVVAFNPALFKKAERLSSDVQETIAVEWARHILGSQIKNIKKIPGVEVPYFGVHAEFFQDGDAVLLWQWPSEEGEVGIVVDRETAGIDQKINAPALSTKMTEKTNRLYHARLNDQEIAAYYGNKRIPLSLLSKVAKEDNPVEPIEHGIITIIDRKNRESRLLLAVEGDADMGTFKVAPNGDIMTLFGCKCTHSYKEGTIPILKVWDSQTGALKWQLPIRKLDSNNNFLINNQGELLARNVDNDICLWDETGNLKNIVTKGCDAKSSGLYLIDNGDTTGVPTLGFAEGVNEVKFLPQDDVLLVYNKQLKIVDRVTLQEKFRLDASNSFSKVRFFPNGFLCVEEGFIPSTLHFIDTNACRVTKSVHVGNTHHSLSENSLRILPNGELLVLYANEARIFNMETGREHTLRVGTKKLSTKSDSYDPNYAQLHDSFAQCKVLPTGDILTVDRAYPTQEIALWDGVTCALKKRINADFSDCLRKLEILPIGYIVGVENDEFVLREPYALQEIYRKKFIPEDAPEDHREFITVDAYENNDFSVTRGFERNRIVKLSTTLHGLCHKLFAAGEVSMKTMCEISEQMAQEETLQDSVSQ